MFFAEPAQKNKKLIATSPDKRNLPNTSPVCFPPPRLTRNLTLALTFLSERMSVQASESVKQCQAGTTGGLEARLLAIWMPVLERGHESASASFAGWGWTAGLGPPGGQRAGVLAGWRGWRAGWDLEKPKH